MRSKGDLPAGRVRGMASNPPRSTVRTDKYFAVPIAPLFCLPLPGLGFLVSVWHGADGERIGRLC